MSIASRYARVVMAALCLSSTAAAQGNARATVAGSVSDTSGTPLPQADVSFPALGVWTRTTTSGGFKITNLPEGNHRILVRRIGYAPIEEVVRVGAGTTALEPFRLVRLTTLDTVVTRGSYRDPGMEEFAERRNLGLGHFVTKAELDQRRGALVSSFLMQTPGLAIASVAGKEWIGSKRAMSTSCRGAPARVPNTRMSDGTARCLRSEGLYYVPDEPGAHIMCHARVFLDEQLMNPGAPTPPFDLRSIVTTQVEAIEWYAGPSQMPLKYMARNSTCGVLVIRTRRP